jgi:hypothetical protein
MPLVTQTFNHKTLMRIAIVMAFVQFTNALEYMALTPVFAFMADGFSVPVSFSGYVSGMYTLGAVLSGIMAFYWIDLFNKKQFLFKNMVLLGALTFLSTLTTHFGTLLALRFCAGLVGDDNGRGYEYFDKLCPGKLTWKNAGNGHCIIFAGQYRRHASYIIFVHALWLAYCAMVNQFTLSVIFTVDSIYYPQGYALAGRAEEAIY